MIAARLFDPVEKPVVIFAMMMFILLLAPVVMQRLKLPSVVGLIGAGVVFGPNMVGLIERDATFQLMGQVGLLYILFNAGLEIDLAGFRKARLKSAGFGSLSFLIPQVVGASVVYAMGLLDHGWTAAILLASMFGSHTLLAYPVASRLGLTRHRAVTVTLGATMVTDVSALLVLAVVASSVGGSGLGPWFWLKLVGSFGLLVGLAFTALPRVASWYFREQETDGPAAFLFVMASVFSLAWLADATGLQAILGAFMAGLALNRLIPVTSPLMSRIQFMGDALFIPFFLVSVGMLADFSVLLTGWRAWAMSLVMSGLVLVTKWGAAMLAGTLFRYTREEKWLMFGLSVPQAAATLAAVMVGYDLGLFDDTVLNGTILMILVTCVVGPAVVEAQGRLIAARAEQVASEGDELPQRIMVPLANPDHAGALVDIALLMRDGLSDQPVFPLMVALDGPGVEERLARGEKVLSHAVVHAAAASVSATPVTRVDRNITAAILRAIRETRISHVVVGWDGRASGTHAFGRLLDPLITEGRSAVFICHLPGPVQTCRRVVLMVPPWSERGPGFDEMVGDLKLLTQRLSAPLLVMTTSEESSSLERRFKERSPTVPTRFEGMSRWSDLIPHLREQVQEDDLLVLLSARKGTIAWEASLESIPGVLAREFSDVVSITAFTSEAVADQEIAAVGVARRDPNRVIEVLAPDHEGALREVVDALGVSDPGKVAHLHQELLSGLSRHSHEVAPGVVLLDLRDEAVPGCRTVLAHSAGGVGFPGAGHPVDLILVVFSVQHRKVSAHLKELAWTASLLRNPERVAALRQARTAHALNLALSSVRPGDGSEVPASDPVDSDAPDA